MTFPQTIDPAQANKETPIQEDLLSAQGSAAYGRRAATTAGLTFGYHGNFMAVAAGTQLLGASTTTYMVVNKSTLAVSFSTSTTNWNDSTNYGRAYLLTTNGSGITAAEDHRHLPGGILCGGAAGGGGGSVELKGLTFTSDTGSTADSDPGAGLFKWNNATQGSATKLFIDDSTADGVSLATYFGSLGAAGEIFIQQSDDAAAWQLWRWTAVANDTGYRDFTVTLQAKGTDIDDGVVCYFDFEEDDTGSAGTTGKHSIYIAAGSITPSATGGCAALATIASAANQPDIQTLDFDATTQEYAQFGIVMPKSWDEGTVTFKAHWSHAATTTNFGVVWDLQALAVSDDDAIAQAFGTAQTSTDTGGTTNDLYSSPESSAITVAGTPASEDMVFFRLSRVTGNGSDTMAIDARLHGITLYVTTNAENDA
jgi:hypothetical protein